MKEQRVVPKGKTWESLDFFRPKESKDCPDGYKGRIGIYEVMSVTETIKNLIVKGAIPDEIEKQARTEGMLTMIEDGMIKAAQGATSIEEVLRVTSE